MADTATYAAAMKTKYVGFKKLASKIAKQGGVRDPNAVAAAIGRKKYGADKFNKAAAQGKLLKGAKARVRGG